MGKAGQSAQGEAGHCDVNPGFGGFTQCFVVLAQAGGPIGRLYEIEIELPDFTTRSYRQSTSRKRSKKSRKVVSKTTSSSKSPNRQPGVNQVVKTIDMKPKRARGKSAPRQPKPESPRAAQKRIQENAK